MLVEGMYTHTHSENAFSHQEKAGTGRRGAHGAQVSILTTGESLLCR